MEDARTLLSRLLQEVNGPHADPTTLIEAATLANRLALFHGDPSLADVAESLAVSITDEMSESQAQSLQAERAVARAARRAIALAHRHQLHSPRDLALSLVADPDTLIQEIQTLLTEGNQSLARAALEVAVSRHPQNSTLNRLHHDLSSMGGSQPIPLQPTRSATPPQSPGS